MTIEDNQQKLNETLTIFKKYHIEELTKQMMEEYYDKAMVFLNKINLTETKASALTQLADTLMKRKK